MSKPNCVSSETCTTWERARSPFVRFVGQKNPDVFVVGGAPSYEEDQQGANFVGDGGSYLRNILKSVGFRMPSVAMGYVVKCMPINAQGKQRNLREGEIKKCKPHILSEIAVLKPKVVLLLGAEAFKAILNEKGIASKRGRPYEREGIVYVPTIKPDMVLYDPGMADSFISDVALAYNISQGLVNPEQIEPEEVDYKILKTTDELDMLVEQARAAEEIAYDLETNMLQPYYNKSKIVCASFSFIEREAFTIPLFHAQPIFNDKEMTYARKVLKEIMTNSVPKIAHGGKFDNKWLKATEGIVVENFAYDTMLSQYLLFEEAGKHSLSYCAFVYTTMGGYDEPLETYKKMHKECDPDRGGSYANIPWDVMLPYAGGDTDCTIRVHHKIEPLMKQLEEYKK